MKKVFKALGITLIVFFIAFLAVPLMVVYPFVGVPLVILCAYTVIAYTIWEGLDD